MTTPAVIVVGADKGGVGKTTVSRTLLDYFWVASVPFLEFVASKGTLDQGANYSFVLRSYVRHWLANVWSEYDRIKLTDIVGSTGPNCAS
jgi:hypothetical protein